MKMNEKLEIMLSRKRIKKTDFAHSIGITYRAFANYLNGTRNPRAETLQKMADQLQLTPEFLKDDSQELELRSEEHTSALQSHLNLVCRLLLEKKKI